MVRTLVFLLVMLPSTLLRADDTIDLFRDDFSRFPSGKLTKPVELANPAIQEYHYLPHRGVPLGPWANAICYLDCWAVGAEEGQPYLEQYLTRKGLRMKPKLFSPVFVTGDPLWSDYTVEISVKPLSPDDMAGVVFRYKTNRHHYLFCLQGGNQARLALRLPLEEKLEVIRWKELGTVPFPYDSSRYYRLKVETKGTSIRASIDGKLLLTAEDDGLLRGKAGVSANVPAHFRDFHAYASSATKQEIDTNIQKREDELTKLQAGNPTPKLWKKFKTPQFGTGRSVRFGDLNGDGVPEMLFAQNLIKREQGNFIQITCVTAVTLEGKVLWQIGDPNPDNALATYDCAFQIHDIDGDGLNEVVMTKDFTIQVLDGLTGKKKKSAPLPQVTEEDRAYYAKRNHPNQQYRGDSIAFFNFSGGKDRHDILVKDRQRVFWIWDNDLNPLWSGRGHQTGHYPFPFHNKSTGRDDLLVGYARWDHQGKQLWTRDAEVTRHADSVAFGNFSDDPNAQPMGYYGCSNEGFVLIDSQGIIRQHHRIGHAQNASVAKLRGETPGLQYACINFWYNPGIVTLLDYSGRILQQGEPMHSGSSLLPVNWQGDGREFLLLSGNVREGGMIDGQLRRVVMFPDDGHPDMCTAVLDLTGDPRDEIVLWDPNEVWIYTQDRAFTGKRIYAPQRNPNYNESNYRAIVSLSAWQDVAE